MSSQVIHSTITMNIVVVLIVVVMGYLSAGQKCGNCTSGKSCGLQKKMVIIRKNGCHVIRVKIDACGGCCRSSTYPIGNLSDDQEAGEEIYESRAQCCSIADSHPRSFPVTCGGGAFEQAVEIRTATKCKCGICKSG